jgi:hypothetical protein
MYYIKKYADCWAIHDDITGASRKLTTEEVKKITIEFPSLKDEKVITFYTDRIRSIQPEVSSYPNPAA